MKSFYSFLFLMLTVAVLFPSCKKDCFDQELYNAYQAVDCTADCPGVTGCDGQTYCNECVAAQHGIRVD